MVLGWFGMVEQLDDARILSGYNIATSRRNQHCNWRSFEGRLTFVKTVTLTGHLLALGVASLIIIGQVKATFHDTGRMPS